MIEETGSLRSASISMGLAYTKALRMINKAEKELGFSLTKRSTGGRSGGGSTLTPEGKEWLKNMKPTGMPVTRPTANSIWRSFQTSGKNIWF